MESNVAYGLLGLNRFLLLDTWNLTKTACLSTFSFRNYNELNRWIAQQCAFARRSLKLRSTFAAIDVLWSVVVGVLTISNGRKEGKKLNARTVYMYINIIL